MQRRSLVGKGDLGNGATNAEIWATVTDYYNEKTVTPVDNIAVVEPSPGRQRHRRRLREGHHVSSDAVGFSRARSRATATPSGRSRKRSWKTSPARRRRSPWALPILRVTRMVARVNGAEHNLSGSRRLEGWLRHLSGGVDIIAYNDQKLGCLVSQRRTRGDRARVARLIHLPAGSRFADGVLGCRSRSSPPAMARPCAWTSTSWGRSLPAEVGRGLARQQEVRGVAPR